ncbi:MAG: hypothetical protein HW421_1632 [Ignavibacteria bacterium]|nr:hypothetical protein [Ignavibacteria bacterium]
MSETPAPAKKGRLIFIDVMRGIAVLWMVETHVVDVCLGKWLKTGWFYNILSISNGFVAVSFLFCAGAGFWLASMKKSDDYKHFRPPLWDYLRRLGFIMLLAYWMHAPVMSLSKFLKLPFNVQVQFAECDILQAIVVSSLIALAILMLTPKLKYIPYIFAILAILIFSVTGLVLNTEPIDSMPAFLGAYFSNMKFSLYKISKFPLFPWAGYFFAGAAITAAFMAAENKKRFAQIFFVGGFFVMYFLYFTNYWPWPYPGRQDWWYCSPWHSIFRTSCAVWVFSLLYLIEDKIKGRRFTKMLEISGQESLFIYVFHNLIVYGSLVSIGLRFHVNMQLVYWQTGLVFLAIAIFSYYLSKGWHYIKQNNMKAARAIMVSAIILFVLVILVNPY